MRKLLAAFASLSMVLLSCQKEVDFSDPPATGGSSNGDLLVKAVQITPGTNDTNTVTLTWDAQRRLTSYNSRGMVNTIPSNIETVISRDGDGRITKILGKANAPFSSSDSVVYEPHYVPNTMQLSYSIGTQYGGPMHGLKDSSVFTYNAAGQVTGKISYSDFFGSWDPVSKQEYTWDANGNVTKITDFAADLFSGTFSESAVTTYTFNSHKNASVMGAESLFFLGAGNMSKNMFTRMVTNAVSSGTTYTTQITGDQYNSFDRPTQATITVTPGNLVNNITYYYQ